MTDILFCDDHGPRPETWICQHIHEAGRDGPSPGFNYVANADKPFPDAWCDAGEAHLMANGGNWNDQTETFTKVTALCSDCYLEYREVAESEGKVRAH